MKPQFLYHGSVNKLEGKVLIPRIGVDFLNRPDNLIKAVYATEEKDIAIAMVLLKSTGVIGARLSCTRKAGESRKWDAIIYWVAKSRNNILI